MTEKSVSSAESAPVLEPTFDSIPLSREVRRAIDELGYTHPTPVQRAVFESAAAGKDVVVQARTGTGKTAAFGLPIVDRLVDVSQRETQVLILSPTRELALQINRELENLGKHKGVECAAVYGGASMQPQIDAIRRGVPVIAGTPGRVLDHLERGTLDPRKIRTLVLDESDEMLSMGFLPQITRIMEQLPKKHQTLLFSATMPADVKRIAETRLTDPEFITLSGDHIGALSIDHFIYRSTGNKSEELVKIIEIENPESAIIFCNTRDQTKRLANALNKKGYSADWLNADLAQNDREKVMKATRESRLRFLVCTDVAARGIDISHLTHVINADFPDSTENYVHRTGRTGRAGKTGTAISLITPQDVGNLYILRLTYKIFPVERELPNASDLQTRKEADLVDFLARAFAAQPQTTAESSLARRVLTSDVAEGIVAGLLRDHLGGHPHADEKAADNRRAAMPPPVVEEAPARAERKAAPPAESTKKRERSDTSVAAKKAPPAKSAQRVERAETPVKRSRDAEERATKPVKEETEARTPRRDEAPRSTQKNDAPRERAALPKERTAKTDAKKSNGHPSGLEVVSARALLDESERALLDGESDRAPEKRSPKKTNPEHDDENVGRIFVDAGKRDDVYKDDFLDTLVDNGFNTKNVLFVNVRDTHSFIGVTSSSVDEAVRALNGRDVAGLEVTAEKARPRRN